MSNFPCGLVSGFLPFELEHFRFVFQKPCRSCLKLTSFLNCREGLEINKSMVAQCQALNTEIVSSVEGQTSETVQLIDGKSGLSIVITTASMLYASRIGICRKVPIFYLVSR